MSFLRKLFRFSDAAPIKIPARIDLATASHFRLRQHCRRLGRLMRTLSRRRDVPPEVAELARAQLREIRSVLWHHPLNADLQRLITETEEQLLPRLGLPPGPLRSHRRSGRPRRPDGILRILHTFGQRVRYSLVYLLRARARRAGRL